MEDIFKGTGRTPLCSESGISDAEHDGAPEEGDVVELTEQAHTGSAPWAASGDWIDGRVRLGFSVQSFPELLAVLDA